MALPPAYARRSASHGMPRRRSLLAALLAIGIAITGLALGSAPAVADEVVPPVASLEIEVADCEQYGGQGVLHYVVRDPYDYYQDFITVYDAADQIVHEAVYRDGTMFEADVALAPGEYLIVYTVERETGGANVDRQEFTIGACPDLDVALIDPTCSTGDDGLITLVLSGLVVGESYDWEAGGFQGTLVAEADTVQIPLASGSPPGNYIAYAEWNGDGVMFDWRAFAIEPCQPVLAATVAQCTVSGGTASVHIALSNLVHGVAYTVTGPDSSTQQATAQPSGVTNLTFASLKPGTTGAISVEGVWTVDEPYEEPPYIGGGDFIPLETVVLATQADVTLDPCPAATAKPAAKPGATLPAAGIDGVGPTILGAVTALTIGGLLLGAARRRNRGHPAD